MSDDDGWQIAPAPFDAAAALQTLKRFARDQQLAERSDGWMLGAGCVLQLALAGDAIQARLARGPARTPEWDAFTLRSHPELRKLQDEIKRRLLRWKGAE